MSTPGGEKDTAGGGSLAKLWGQLQDSLTRRLANDKHAKRDRLILLLATISVVTFLILPDQHFLSVTYKAGEIAVADVRSPGDFLIEDIPLTDKKRADAEAAAPVVYDLRPAIGQDIAEQEIPFPEEQIAGIDGTIGQDAEFGAAGRTSHLREFGVVHAVGDEARTEDRTHMRGAEPLFHDGCELVKRNGRVNVLAVQGVAVDQIEFLWLKGEDIPDEHVIH